MIATEELSVLHAALILPVLLLFSTILVSQSAFSAVIDCQAVSAGLSKPVVFEAPAKSGETVEVQALLRKPAGDRKFAAVIMLHGSGGVRPPRCYEGAVERFTRWGYVTLLIDSPSQIDRSGNQVYRYSFEDQAYHARGAASYLASLPYVDTDRIGIIGWSKGGGAVLVAVTDSKVSSTNGERLYRAAVAVYPYPGCLRRLDRLDAPLLVLLGEEDKEIFVSSCKDMQVSETLALEYQLKAYPGAEHLFDARWLSTYNEAAAQDAKRKQRQFFAKYLQ